QEEQLNALTLVKTFLTGQSEAQIQKLHKRITPYIQFRQTVDDFLCEFFNQVCTQNCYQSHRSACCSKDGIITFFADVLINALVSTSEQLTALEQAIQNPEYKMKCIYLKSTGCLWQIKPSVCVMFLCENAQQRVFEESPHAKPTWQELKQWERSFKWPDRPVLFDWLEQCAMDSGFHSPLMYLHTSPGLIRIKQLAGLI
ncbi:MAG: hypothetical protein PVI90_20290, partial [Desulfobacteraceae bacterium]